MAITVSSPVREGILIGGLRWKIVDITLDTSYPTGGYALGSNVVGLTNLIGGQPIGGNSTSGGYKAHYDYVNSKLMMFRSAGFTPAGTVAAPTFTGDALAAHRHSLFVATGATDATGARVNAATNSLAMNNAAATIAGIGAASGSAGGVVDVTGGTPTGTNSAPTFTGTAVAAGVLAEVANAVDLHTSIIRVMLYGD